MKHHPPKAPLVVRRLIGPLLLLILAGGLVFVLKDFAHESLRDAQHDYGSFVIGLAILYLAVCLINYFVFDLVFRLRRGSEAPALLREIAALLIFGVGLALLLRFLLSVHLTAVLATSALITAVVGFALQDTLGNLFSGLSLHLENSLEVGDLVRIGETIGLVEALSWRAIKVRTFLDSVILLSNSAAAREKLEVFPRSSGPAGFSFKLNIDSNAAPPRVIEVLESAAASAPGVAAEPKPIGLFSHFGDYAPQYEVRFWLKDFAKLPKVDSAVKERVWYALRREGITVPIPSTIQYHFNRDWVEEPRKTAAILSRVEILTPLSEAEREILNARLQHVEYAPAEDVVVQGQKTANALYVVESGELSVIVVRPSGREVEVGTLAAGEAFGEMAILTGEPRSATVRAKIHSLLYRIDKDALGIVLAQNPKLPGEITRLVEGRREKTQRLLEDAGATGRHVQGTQDSLLVRVGRFFGLEGLA